MDGLTVRPLGKGRFAPVASPDQGEPSCPPVEPPDQRSRRAPLEPMTKAQSPLEPDEGLSRPSTTRRRLSRPGTHDQSFRALDDEQEAVMPLHPDEGIAPPRPRAPVRCEQENSRGNSWPTTTPGASRQGPRNPRSGGAPTGCLSV